MAFRLPQVMIIDGYCTLGSERETQWTEADQLAAMDRAGVRRSLIAPEDREIAWRNREGNERIAHIAANTPDRFIPACSVNPWSGREGLDWLGEAAATGVRLLVLAPALQGFTLGDELSDPLLARALELRLAVYVHTGPQSASGPAQLALLAERFPEIRWIVGHCGVSDHSYDFWPLLAEGRPNLWFELSFIRPWVMPRLIPTGRRDRLIFGSSAPRNDLDFELSQFDHYLPVRDYPDVYGENLLQLLEGGSQ